MGFLTEHYRWLLAFHVISVIAWMAGMLYLPRLFVYHVDAPKGSQQSETFKIMEKKLLRLIINPAMIAAFLFGILMLIANPALLQEPWMHMKLASVILLSGLHGFFAKTVKIFARDENTRPAKFYRIINEVPAVLMAIIVIMVIVRPF
ncbi:MAG: protoporphyrinogen oxidase HemJ [Alphaproteobacteria bacterium PRO2]|nr:protoporphyrinogen oxidase HemJ [Alphaproteobacteria bacterium PRO2]